MHHNTKQSNQNYSCRIPKKDMSAFEEELGQIDWQSLLSSENLETAHKIFIEELKNVRNKYTKLVGNRHRKNNLPWINEQVWMLMKKRDTALKKAIKSGLQQDRLLFNSLRNKVVKTVRQAKAQFFINILNEAKGKWVWQTIKKLMKKDIKSCNKCLELDFKV